MAKRRGKGEGSIYRRKSDGKWVGTLDLGWVDGKRKRRTIYGRTEQDVRIRLFDIRAARKRGTRVTTPQYRTVGQVLDGWLKSTGNSELRPRTFDSYNMIVSRHLAPKLGTRQSRTSMPKPLGCTSGTSWTSASAPQRLKTTTLC